MHTIVAMFRKKHGSQLNKMHNKHVSIWAIITKIAFSYTFGTHFSAEMYKIADMNRKQIEISDRNLVKCMSILMTYIHNFDNIFYYELRIHTRIKFE